MDWYILSVIALFLMGGQRFLYMVSARRGCNSAGTTFTFMGTVTVLSVIAFFVLSEPVPNFGFLLLVAFVNSISFTLATLSHIETLKHIPAGVAYPIIMLNGAVVVIFSVLFFHDRLSGYQIVGILLAIFIVTLLGKERNSTEIARRDLQKGFILISVCVLCGAAATISSKFAAAHTNKTAFMALSYLLGTSFSYASRNRMGAESTDENKSDALIIGITMGIVNFAGFYVFLWALESGPLSIISSIVGLHFVIPVILSAAIYSEKITTIRFSCILLTILSIALLRLRCTMKIQLIAAQ
jgi:drug/metabolite transporter (DMT)-like permease